MQNKRTVFFTVILSFVLFSILQAQPKNNSPYSRYGLGDIHDDNFFFGQAMGNLGATLIDPWHINLNNPATYSYLQATAFEVGLDASYSRLNSDNNSSNIFSGNVNYFALGLPIVNPINDLLERVKRDYDFALVFALKPYSNVGYDIFSTEDHPDEGIIERNYVGSGGTYKFLTGVSGRYKNLSFGANAGYLFGQINYRSGVFFPDLPYAYSDDFLENFSVSGFLYDVGFTYSLTLNKAAIFALKTIPGR